MSCQLVTEVFQQSVVCEGAKGTHLRITTTML